MKRAIAALLLASLLLLTGCFSPEARSLMKSKFAPDDTCTKGCRQFTGTNVYGRSVERSIGLEIIQTAGSVGVTVRDQNSCIVYQTTVAESTALMVEVPERGMYYVHLDLHAFTGSYTIDWSN